MGREVSIMEDEIELSLELSIGGSYAKSDTQKNTEEKTGDFSTFEENDDKIDNDNVNNLSVSRSDFVSDVEAENGFGLADLQKRRGIQALRRHEARIKREEKLKKSRGVNNGGVLLEDKLVLEAQQFRARVQERESREREWVSEDSGWKREKNGTKEAVQDLNISLFTENAEDNNSGNDFAGRIEILPVGINGCVVHKDGEDVVRAAAENGGRNSFVDCDTGKWVVVPPAAAEDGSLEQCSPAVSDYHSMSHKGENNSDTGSQSSSLPTHQNASSRDKIDLKVNHPSLLRSTPQLHSSISKMIEKPKIETHSSNETNHTSSTIDDPTTPISKDTNRFEPIKKPPKISNHHHDGASIQRMPCVSTTGNGPNGKTITGFLYKYTATEVSIMCVCHGSSFSPAGFVEHAGGVDVTNPLRHITIVTRNLAS